MVPTRAAEGVPSIPEPVRDVAGALRRAGHRAWLVGECLPVLLCGESPPGWEIATTAGCGQALAIFPTAVPTRLADSTITVPTRAGPVDVTRTRDGESLEHDLQHRDFTIHAMGFDPESENLLDPYGGARDLAARALRCVGDARARLAESPVRALRAARLVAERGFEPDPELERAMAAAGPALASVPPLLRRRELVRILLAPHAGAGLALLRRTGVEAAVAPGTRADAAELIEAQPRRLAVRLACWLRDAPASRVLRDLRFGVPLATEVRTLLAHHPIEDAAQPERDPAVRKLLRRLDDADLEALFQLRESELQASSGGEDASRARKRLDALRGGIERARAFEQQIRRRTALAIGGREVIEALGCRPGRRVGEALQFLGERIAADPALNRPERLIETLQAWARENPE